MEASQDIQDIQDTSVEPHQLCQTCKAFWKGVPYLRFSHHDLRHQLNGAPELKKKLPFHDDHASISRGADYNCHFCSIVYRELSDGNIHNEHPVKNDDPILASFDISDFPANSFKLSFHNGRSENTSVEPLMLAPHHPEYSISIRRSFDGKFLSCFKLLRKC